MFILLSNFLLDIHWKPQIFVFFHWFHRFISKGFEISECEKLKWYACCDLLLSKFEGITEKYLKLRTWLIIIWGMVIFHAYFEDNKILSPTIFFLLAGGSPWVVWEERSLSWSAELWSAIPSLPTRDTIVTEYGDL